MRKWLGKILEWLRRVSGFERPTPPIVERRADCENEPRDQQPPNAQANHPAAQAFEEIFSPRHAAEEQTAFRPVPPNSVVEDQKEEWYREGNGLRTRLRKTRVVTPAGAIVESGQLKGVCRCGAFVDSDVRCHQCGCNLCRTHSRVFPSPSGEVVLCDEHYRAAMERFDTWAAWDDQNRKAQGQ